MKSKVIREIIENGINDVVMLDEFLEMTKGEFDTLVITREGIKQVFKDVEQIPTEWLKSLIVDNVIMLNENVASIDVSN